MTEKKRTVLIVDDDPGNRALIRAYLRRDPENRYEVLTAATVREGLDMFRSHAVDGVVLDHMLPDMTGLDFLKRMTKLEKGKSVPVFYITSQGCEMVAVEAMKAGATDYLPKERLSGPLFLGHLEEAFARKAEEERIKYLAMYDELTGLPNRSLLFDRLHTALAGAHRQRAHLALVLLDLDGFKAVNDEMGHDGGDDVLRVVATRLKECTRESDTVARLGGDEFILLVPDVDSREEIDVVCERISAVIEEPMVVKGRSFLILASVGASLYPQDGEEADTLIRKADAAMYAVKRQGRNRNRS